MICICYAALQIQPANIRAKYSYSLPNKLNVSFDLYILFWIWILNKVELRYAYPVASLAIIFAVLYQSYINKNFPPFSYWFGIIMIIIGLFIAIYKNK